MSSASTVAEVESSSPAPADERRHHREPIPRSFVVRSVITAIFAAATLFFGVADFIRAINPKFLVNISTGIYLLPSMVFAILLGNVALFVGITDPQITLRYIREFWLARVGIIAAAIGLILSIVSGFITLNYPNGVMTDDASYRIPLSNTAQVEGVVEDAAGECTSGWATLTTIQYHGIEYVNTCQTNHSAIIVFDNDGDSELGMDGVQKAALKHIYGMNGAAINKTLEKEGYAALNGSRWAIISPTSSASKLQKAWGGRVVSLNSRMKELLK